MPYEESVRVLLFVRRSGVPAGSKVERLAANTDLTPIFTLGRHVVCGRRAFDRTVAPRRRSSMASVILLELLAKKASRRTPPYDATRPCAAIRTESQKYVEYQTGDKELYDLEADAYEMESMHDTVHSPLVGDLQRSPKTLTLWQDVSKSV